MNKIKKRFKQILSLVLTFLIVTASPLGTSGIEVTAANNLETYSLCKDSMKKIEYELAASIEASPRVESSDSSILQAACTNYSPGSSPDTTVLELQFDGISTGEANVKVYDSKDALLANLEVHVTEHIWSEDYTVDKETSCKETGSQSIHCKECDMIQEGSEKEIPVSEHKIYYSIRKDNEYRYRVPRCENCDTVFEESKGVNSYKINFNLNGAAGDLDNEIKYFGKDYIFPDGESVKRTGYKLNYWWYQCTDINGNKGDWYSYVPGCNTGTEGLRDSLDRFAELDNDLYETGAITVNAYMTPITYTVKFDGNGGTGAIFSKILSYGEEFKPYGDFTRPGYVYYAWNTKPDGSGTSYPRHEKLSNLSLIDGDVVTLYPLWMKLVPVTFYYMDSANSEETFYTCAVGRKYLDYTVPEPSREGYIFKGWFTKAEGGEKITKDTVITNPEEHALYAHWELSKLSEPVITELSNVKEGVTLGWNKVEGAEGFYIYRKSGNGNYSRIKTISGSDILKFTDSSVKRGTTYTYAVQAYYKNIVSTYSGKTIKCASLTVPVITYRTHVQTYGWQAWMKNGEISGTSGEAKRLEAIYIDLKDQDIEGSIEYRTHVQSYGWQDWVSKGQLSGTSGKAKRLEAIQIRLTGELEKEYDVYYRVHAQTYGWLGWAKNGECAGSSALSKRLEAIQIKLVEKGKAAPGNTTGAYVTPSGLSNKNFVTYRTHVQTYGWQSWMYDGVMSGTTGLAKRLEGINIKLVNPEYSGSIQYKTHIQTYGWENGWKSDGIMSGTSGKAKRLEAIQIQLTGEMAKHYDVYYRVHAQTFGWLGWAKNGSSAGTAGYAKRLEGIEIELVEKGGAAPGSMVRSFIEK